MKDEKIKWYQDEEVQKEEQEKNERIEKWYKENKEKVDEWYKKREQDRDETVEQQVEAEIKGKVVWYKLYIIFEWVLIALMIYVWLSGYACKYECIYMPNITDGSMGVFINTTHIGGLP